MTARLGHHASQRVFRELLGVLARPGTLGQLGAMAPHPALLVPLALADVDVGEIHVARRVVPAYRTPPGPQLLGRTLDYTGRLIDFSPEAAQRAAVRANGPTAAVKGLERRSAAPLPPPAPAPSPRMMRIRQTVLVARIRLMARIRHACVPNPGHKDRWRARTRQTGGAAATS